MEAPFKALAITAHRMLAMHAAGRGNEAGHAQRAFHVLQCVQVQVVHADGLGAENGWVGERQTQAAPLMHHARQFAQHGRKLRPEIGSMHRQRRIETGLFQRQWRGAPLLQHGAFGQPECSQAAIARGYFFG